MPPSERLKINDINNDLNNDNLYRYSYYIPRKRPMCDEELCVFVMSEIIMCYIDAIIFMAGIRYRRIVITLINIQLKTFSSLFAKISKINNRQGLKILVSSHTSIRGTVNRTGNAAITFSLIQDFYR